MGIAMGTGTEVAIQSAGVTRVKGDLAGIARARGLSRATMRNIREPDTTFVYDVTGIPMGWRRIPPLACCSAQSSGACHGTEFGLGDRQRAAPEGGPVVRLVNSGHSNARLAFATRFVVA